MADYFVDSSALVKAYIAEMGTNWVRTILDDEQHQIYISQLTELEVVAALTRRFRVGDLTLQERDQAARASALKARYVLSNNHGYGGLTLISADLELNDASTLEGFQTEDPNNHL